MDDELFSDDWQKQGAQSKTKCSGECKTIDKFDHDVSFSVEKAMMNNEKLKGRKGYDDNVTAKLRF